VGAPRWKAFYKPENSDKPALPPLNDVKALATVIWRQGFKRNTRFRFWRSLARIARRNPANFEQYVVTLAHNEHFQEYRAVVTQEIEEQLACLPPEPPSTSTSPARELQPA
jgi:hypothetical protein